MSDVTIGAKLVLDSHDGIQSMKDFKKEIKEAQGDLVGITEKFGATSREAREAAKRVAELKDRLGDAKNLADAFNPDKKFQALTQALGAATGGFAALQGAMGLLGVESESVQKQLLKVQSALALSQGLNMVGDSIQSIKTLGQTLVNNLGKNGLIGVAIAGVALLAAGISGMFSSKQTQAAKAYNDTLKDFQRAAAGAIQDVNKVKVAFDLAREGVISKNEALKTYNETLGDSFGKTNDLATAEKMLADKADVYIKITALKAQANALFQKSAEKAADALIDQQDLLKNKFLDKGGIFDLVSERARKNIADAKQGAQDIQNIGEDLLKQAEVLAKANQIITGGGSVKSISKGGGVADPLKSNIKFGQLLSDREINALLEKEEEEYQRRVRERLEKHIDGLILLYKGQTENLALERSKQIQTDLETAAAQRAIDEAEANARILTAQFVADQLSIIADLIGKQTAAGKVLAIASATISTYLAATKALAGDYSAYGPAASFVRIATVISTIALGLKQVREIVKVNVPGASGGSVPSGQSAPLTPQASVTNTLLNQNQLNQIGNAAVRAFVIESDVTNNQERIRRINRAARI